ncbi:rhodanese-like domain-containing protein [Alsobacter sp. SYSU M60028]|uniref:Rhodanese-like domain-containing protein n=1 Tax=Alsobacter ponti TaxID=2962936 RepID=A0ABT1LFG6_9HYPH|nr:rhodanese-like domain-containing protein [Alsobacter ponti]MCP8939696.1 rhodanese-like domain-containing protein [Alsobacter ponti]
MFSLFKKTATTTLEPARVHELLSSSTIALVDVREPGEFGSERIPGAINVPLSRFADEAHRIPTDKPVVLHCLSGGRSKTALDLCARLGLPIDTHMGGGISAWKAAGLPTAR